MRAIASGAKSLCKYFEFWGGYFRCLRRGVRVTDQPHIFLNIEDDRFNRYLHCLISFFLIEGWRVSVKHHFRYLNSSDRYSLAWYKKGVVRVVFREPNDTSLQLSTQPSEKNLPMEGYLSADYFGGGDPAGHWKVPMAMHPMHYESEWRRTFEMRIGQREGILFAGNVDPRLYGSSALTLAFGIPTRSESLSYLKSNLESNLWEDGLHTISGSESPYARKLFVCDRDQSDISGASFRETLAHFAFFLSLPGWAVPLCHNAVEALSVGCVPIIHRIYAKHLHVKLKDGVNCLMYTSLDELVAVVGKALAMQAAEITHLSRNAKALYEECFTPSAVVNGVLNAVNEGKEIRLFAELESLRLLSEVR